MTVTISVPELHARINDIRLLDVRWRLGAPNGRPAAEGHLPGAVYVDLESTLSAHPGPGDGRHPLPDRAALQDAVRGWGVNDGDTVVAYDDTGNRRRPARGGCCATPACPTSGCWTAASRRGRRPVIRWSPVR